MFVRRAVSIIRCFEFPQLLWEPSQFQQYRRFTLTRTLETRLYLALKLGDFWLGRASMSSSTLIL